MARRPVARSGPRPQGVLAASAWVFAFAFFAWVVGSASDPWSSLVSGSDPVSTTVMIAVLPFFFGILLAQLAVAARANPGAAPGLGVLGVGVVCCAVGAGVITAAGPPSIVRYPAPEELWFLAGYFFLGAHLFLRPAGRRHRSGAAALDATIVFGGGLCVAGTVLALPVAHLFARQGVPLLVLLLYPALDLALLLVVAGQLVSGTRSLSWSTARLGAAFVALAAGDVGMSRYLGEGTYGKGAILDMLWALGFLLLVSAAVTPDPVPLRLPASDSRSNWVTVVAAAVAVAVLVLRPQGVAGTLLLLPAVLTLVAVGARLMLALRAANGAAEACRLSLTDDLTGMPNRRALLRHLTERLGDDGTPVSLLLLDLDGFKEINDTLGHAAGDTILRIIATRVVSAPTGADFTARLGGDEFALVYGMADPDALIRAAHGVRALVRKRADVDGVELTLDCSVGVAIAGADDGRFGAPADDGTLGCRNDYRELLRRADVAMYLAKSGRDGALLYDPRRDDFSRLRLQLSQELASGIAAGELVVWYQPQHDAGSGEVASFEALIRWQHPTRGLLEPADFLPVARRAGLMPMLTEAMVRMAVDDAAAWHREGLELGVSVNISPTELLSTAVMSVLTTRITDVGLPPERVVVEVTEDSFLAQPDRALAAIVGLRRSGIQVSIDDYGTGFSSLAYLKSLPVQELKIDRSFIRDLMADRRSAVIVSSTVELARGLDLRIVAEGVEDQDAARLLAGMGVHLLQGYHFARPMPPTAVAGWLSGLRSQQLAGR